MIKNAPNIFSTYLFKPKVLQDLRRTGPISQSLLWDVMRKYYIEKGPDAWASKDVPIERTNNPLIAQRYAHSIAAFLRDVAENAKQNNQEAPTVDIVELGCGAGRVGFYLMRALAKLLATSEKNHCPYRFILTDLSPKNIQAIKSRKEFRPYLKSGILDVALYDAEKGGEFQLDLSKDIFSWKQESPIFIVANYLFDTLKIDGFRAHKGALEAVNIYLAPKNNKRVKINDPALSKKVEIIKTYGPVKEGYYGDPVVDQILKNYIKTAPKGNFPIPVGALTILKDFWEGVTAPRGLIIGDKSLRSLKEMVSRAEFGFSTMGGDKGAPFSCSVNIHFLNEYIKKLDGFSILELKGPMVFSTHLFLKGRGHGPQNMDFPEIKKAFELELEKTSPLDYADLLKGLRKSSEDGPPPSLSDYLGVLKVGHFDPFLLKRFEKRIVSSIQFATNEQKEKLENYLPRILNNHYPLNGKDTFLKSIGKIYLALGLDAKAGKYLEG